MSEHDDGNEHAHQHPRDHHHACASLFGCGDEKGTGIIREDIKDVAFNVSRLRSPPPHGRGRSGDFRRLSVELAGRWRRKFLQASGFMGALAVVEPWFAKLARAESPALRRSAIPILKVACTWFPRPRRLCALGCTTPICRPFSPSTQAIPLLSLTPGRIFSMKCNLECRSTR